MFPGVREWEPEPDRPLWVQVYEIIRGRIEAGVYRPRRPVPSLEQLTQEFGIARNTARKVLNRLQSDGLVRKVPSLGTFVVPRDDRDRDGREGEGAG
jgi:GntR family transcriptional regulator